MDDDYDDYSQRSGPSGIGRFFRFFGGLLLGLIVVIPALAVLAVHAPTPRVETAPEAPETAEVDPSAAEPGAPQTLSTRPTDSDRPAPAPSVAAPDASASEQAAGPSDPPSSDSSVEGDFGGGDSTVAALPPNPVQTPSPPGGANSAPGGTTVTLEGPAIRVNAVDFQNSGDLPMVAVVIENAGATSLADDTLLSLSMPLTLAIVPGDQAAADLAAQARLAGYEIVAQLPVASDGSAGLEPGLDAGEVEARAGSQITQLWMAVGALPSPAEGTALDQGLAEGLAAALGPNGYALIDPAVEAGGATEQAASAAGVPFASAAMRIDGRTTSDGAYEMLTEAATRATNEGNIVVMAPASRAMLEGLLRWWLENNGKGVRLAPISAVVGGGTATAGN